MARTFKKYGLEWPLGTSAVDIELYCFKYARSPEEGGLGKYNHAKKAIDLLWNYQDSPTPIVWNPWLEMGLKAACENDVCVMGGGSSCGKSMMMAVLALLYYLADPVGTLCLITSTTIDGAKQRIFKDIKRFWRVKFPGKLVDGKGQIKGINEEGLLDDSRGIKIIPCANIGDPSSRFIGIKAKNMHVFYDELSELPIELVDVWRSNLRTNAADTPPTLMAASNPKSKMDAFGILSKPRLGWNSIDITKCDTWETVDGIYVRFDNTKNPRIVCNRPDWSWFTSQDIIQDAIDTYGDNSPQVLRFYKATFSDDTEEGCLISENELLAGKCDTKPLWGIEIPIKIAAMDPAYTNGGDLTILKTARVGLDVNGNLAICEDKIFNIKPPGANANSTNRKDRSFVIAQRVKEILEEEGVLPENFIFDTTGGLSFRDILSSYIKGDIVPLSYAGKASINPVSAHESTRACDIYHNKVSEIWGTMQQAIKAKQLYGLDGVTMSEIKSRQYTMSGSRIKLEEKKEMRKRIRKSPDRADVTAMLCYLARRIFPGKFGRITRVENTTPAVKKAEGFRVNEYGVKLIDGRYLKEYLKDSPVGEVTYDWRDEAKRLRNLPL